MFSSVSNIQNGGGGTTKEMANQKYLTTLTLVLIALWSDAAGAQTDEAAEQADQAEAGQPNDAAEQPVETAAQPDQVEAQVAAHDERAGRLFAEGDFAASLAEQQAAHALLPATARLFNMAVCQERLGRPREAITLYRRFMSEADAPPDRRRQAGQRISELEAEIAQASEPPGDGVTAPGVGGTPGSASADPIRRGRVLSPVAFYTMIGLTGAAAIAAVVCGAVTLNMHQEFLELYRGEGDSEQLQIDGRNLAMVTDLLIAVTAVFGASALVLGLVTGWNHGEDEDGRGVAVVPSLHPNGAALSVEGRF
jgi:tetratricopeptide (TPR) repeat protein